MQAITLAVGRSFSIKATGVLAAGYTPPKVATLPGTPTFSVDNPGVASLDSFPDAYTVVVAVRAPGVAIVTAVVGSLTAQQVQVTGFVPPPVVSTVPPVIADTLVLAVMLL